VNQFTKIPSLIQILFAEWLAVMFLLPIVSKLYERLHPSINYQSPPLDKADYVFFAIGVLLYFWLLKEILRPRVKRDSWFSFKTGASSGGEYSFYSTHPSYVFIDVLAVGFWWFARWAWSTGWQARVYQGTILVSLTAVIPALRLMSWYVLRLRPKDDDEDERRSSWKPVALLYGVIVAIMLVAVAVVLPMEIREKRAQERKEANLTVVDPASWKGAQTFESLRDLDHSVEGQVATRVIRLWANQKSSAAMTCTNDAGQGQFGTVLATLARYDDVLIFSYSDAGGLVQRAKDNKDKPIEAMGRLTQMPNRVASWKKYCGLEKLSPRPRWVFEEEHP
jgi:uncharacterized membrane protein